MAVLSITYPHYTENLSQFIAHATAKRNHPPVDKVKIAWNFFKTTNPVPSVSPLIASTRRPSGSRFRVESESRGCRHDT
jgi:hypothetical protein